MVLIKTNRLSGQTDRLSRQTDKTYKGRNWQLDSAVSAD